MHPSDRNTRSGRQGHCRRGHCGRGRCAEGPRHRHRPVSRKRRRGRIRPPMRRPPPQDKSTPMSAQPISPLRRRMIKNMTVRNFLEKTQRPYPAGQDVHTFAGTAEPEDFRRFKLHQVPDAGIADAGAKRSPDRAWLLFLSRKLDERSCAVFNAERRPAAGIHASLFARALSHAAHRRRPSSERGRAGSRRVGYNTNRLRRAGGIPADRRRPHDEF